MNKWSIPIILVAFTILGISLYVQQHRDKQNVKPTHEERVEVVEEQKDENSNINSEGSEVVEIQRVEQDSEANVHTDKSEIKNYIQEIWGDNADFGINLAMCESSLNPNAVSPSGKYVGSYQFDKPTFDTNCDGSRESWRNQVVCAYELIQKGEHSRWPNCP